MLAYLVAIFVLIFYLSIIIATAEVCDKDNDISYLQIYETEEDDKNIYHEESGNNVRE